MDEYLTAKEAAEELGIKYPTLVARIHAGKIEAIKKGWSLLIHRDEIRKVKDANSANLESTTR